MVFVSNADQMTLLSAQLSDIYGNLSQELMLSLIRSINNRGTYSLEEDPYLWQIEKLNDMHMLNAQNMALVVEQTGIAEELLHRMIQIEGYKVYQNTWQQLAEEMGSIPYNSVKATLEAYYNQSFRELDNYINQTLLTTNSMNKAYQKMLEEAVAGVNIGMKTADQALREVVMEWTRKGLPSEFIDKGGHVWSIDRYARTVIQSTTYRVYNEMRVMASEEFGVDTFYMSHHEAARPACAPIQGTVVTKRAQGFESGDKEIGYVPSLYDYGWGEPAGTLGINCRHTLTPFVIGVNSLPDDAKDKPEPEEAMENMKQQARQREYERQIRETKKMLETSKMTGDIDLIVQYQTKLNSLRSGLRDLIKEHDFLYRDYARERVFDTGKVFNKASGALSDVNDPWGIKRDNHANMFYERIRNSKIEPIAIKISGNTGYSQESIQQVIEHVFFDKHNLDDGYHRFFPSYDMSQSFQRLIDGKNIMQHDLVLLEHEFFESVLMRWNVPNYISAHDMTEVLYNYREALKEFEKRRGL